METTYILTSSGELYHHGVKGMKWGVRRYQNKDGSLTPAGKKHYAKLTQFVNSADSNRLSKKYKHAREEYDAFTSEIIGRGWDVTDRIMRASNRYDAYHRPLINEISRLEEEYMVRNKNPRIVDVGDIPEAEYKRIEKTAAKNVGYDFDEGDRLRTDVKRLAKERNEEVERIAESILGRYGNIPVPTHQRGRYSTATEELTSSLISTSNYIWRRENNE